jgi:hypothetical protein
VPIEAVYPPVGDSFKLAATSNKRKGKARATSQDLEDDADIEDKEPNPANLVTQVVYPIINC